jgi:hypothetical protein
MAQGQRISLKIRVTRVARFEPALYVLSMPTRAEYLRAEAEKCRAQAKKASSATAMFTLLDLAANMLEQANKAEQEDKQPKA